MGKANKNNRQIGALGEHIAITYLAKNGYSILDTNYWQKWGELDIVALKGEIVHFIEVKTLSYKSKAHLDYSLIHEGWRPEEQVHKFKIGQIAKALQSWIQEKKYKGEWQIDVIGIRTVPHETFATLNFIENVIQD